MAGFVGTGTRDLHPVHHPDPVLIDRVDPEGGAQQEAAEAGLIDEQFVFDRFGDEQQ
ncbi:hypothetical protein [Arthrobacter sp. 49Tsu3.1M3]|uniref:hypothetical protein n=1 Tax=Arthrobacter sp. 49Tsu3.1M3 TaxID=1279029 RepID=UPI0015C481FC|nr:hypothetical protein [Arthrobacter sp. 49Tsu3.1M3]